MTRKALLNGGNAYLNKTASGWTVDVWDLDGELAFSKGETPAPVYHAFYSDQADAVADLDCWAPDPFVGIPGAHGELDKPF